MSSKGDNKSLFYVLGAGALLIGGAVLFHLLSNKDEGAHATSKVLEEIDALGAPKKEANGMLQFHYYKEVFFIIQKHAKQRFAADKQSMLSKRRILLKQGKMSEYKDIVKDMIHKEEQLCGDLLQEAMDHIGLNEQEFMQMH